MKKKLENLLSNAEQSARNVIESVGQAVDQNDDGKFDLQDVSAVADNLEDSVKEHAKQLKDKMDGMSQEYEEKRREYELQLLQPVFEGTFDMPGFAITKFIHVLERDKKYKEKAVCQGSIGYYSDHKEYRMLNIFKDSLDKFDLKFYPDADCEFYYVDPCEPNRYIALDEYFNHLKVVRVNELKRIAQDLGAKQYRITYKEEKASLLSKKGKLSADATKAESVSAEKDTKAKEYSRTFIEAEGTFPGHPPMQPVLKYLESDDSIQTLVSMRMNPNSPLQREKYKINISQVSDMKEKEAAKIDVVLKGLKCAGEVSVASEAKNESRRFWEYDIEF